MIDENYELPQGSRDNSEDGPNNSPKKKGHSRMYDPIVQIKDYLTKNYSLRYNEISNKIEWAPINIESGEPIDSFRNLEDERFHTIMLAIQQISDFRVTTQILRTVLASDYVRNYNPFHGYFSKLPEWNEQQPNYINLVTDRIPTDNREYLRYVFTKWFIGLIACCLDPKVENQIVFLLKGGQGVGKTRYHRSIIPDCLLEYVYEGNINPNNKEHERYMAEKLLIIMDEFDVKTDRQSEALKSLITRSAITGRKPFAINSVKLPRVASFCGTTNREFFLKDPTGNRRFGVINVTGEIDNSQIDFLDNLFSQGYHMWKNKFIFYLDNKDIDRINEVNSNYIEQSYEEELLLATYRPPKTGEERDSYMTATQIAQELSKTNRIAFNGRFAQKIGSLLSMKGFPCGKSNGAKKYAVKHIS